MICVRARSVVSAMFGQQSEDMVIITPIVTSDNVILAFVCVNAPSVNGFHGCMKQGRVTTKQYMAWQHKATSVTFGTMQIQMYM